MRTGRSVPPSRRWLPAGDAAVVAFGPGVAGGHPENGEEGQAGVSTRRPRRTAESAGTFKGITHLKCNRSRRFRCRLSLTFSLLSRRRQKEDVGRGALRRRKI